MDAAKPSSDYQSPLNFGFDGPADNEVSTMVDQYLGAQKDSYSLDDNSWVDSLFMISNPDFHEQMSMPGTMTVSSVENSCHGMQYTEATANILAQLPVDTRQQTSTTGAYDYGDPAQQYYNNQTMQYMDQHFHTAMPSGEHFPLQQNNPGMHSISYYGQSNVPPSHDPFNHNSPMYYVAQSVQNIPGPEQNQNTGNHLTFNYENFASLPAVSRSNTVSSLTHVPQRNRASSSGGNSPSSQSPVSEEEFSEPPPKTLSRRQSKDTTTTKKSKPAKPRRRKRDPNEPTKPVSAYALFFRDKQATIKGSKPDASFGEVSKIVASLWDSLDPEKKSMYKKRTEEAKKDYLQQLAVYRASVVNSSSETSLYIQANYPSRSPPTQLSYMDTRQIYPNGNNLNSSYHIKPDPDCYQHRPHTNENRQIYGSMTEPEVMHKNGNYIGPMVWDHSGMPDEKNGIVVHCKDSMFQNDWAAHQPSPNSSHTKVVI